MQSATSSLDGGFANAVFDAQANFRGVMDAMARPGQVVELKESVNPPPPLLPAMGAIACTLFDADIEFWLDAALASHGAIVDWLVFHTGAQASATPGSANFAIVADPLTMPPLTRFAHGTQEYPDRSATLLLQLPSLSGGPSMTLRGPGVDGQTTISPYGLPGTFADQWRANSECFPRGVDLILSDGVSIICLPRSVRLISGEG